MMITLKHNTSGAVRQVKVGFSWTTLLFGIWVPIFRGDIKTFFVALGKSIITLGIYALIFPFRYNKQYLFNLLEQGYVPTDGASRMELKKRGYIA